MNDELKRLNAQLAWFTRQMFRMRCEKLAPFDPNQLSQLLYKIERSADQDNLSYDQRADLRKCLALPIWDALENGWKHISDSSS